MWHVTPAQEETPSAARWICSVCVCVCVCARARVCVCMWHDSLTCDMTHSALGESIYVMTCHVNHFKSWHMTWLILYYDMWRDLFLSSHATWLILSHDIWRDSFCVLTNDVTYFFSESWHATWLTLSHEMWRDSFCILTCDVTHLGYHMRHDSCWVMTCDVTHFEFRLILSWDMGHDSF